MPFYCETCWVPVDNNGNGMDHFNSKAHLSAVQFQADMKNNHTIKLFCETCSLAATSNKHLEDHLAGSKHRNCELFREKCKDRLYIPLRKEMISTKGLMKKSFTTLDIFNSKPVNNNGLSILKGSLTRFKLEISNYRVICLHAIFIEENGTENLLRAIKASSIPRSLTRLDIKDKGILKMGKLKKYKGKHA